MDIKKAVEEFNKNDLPKVINDESRLEIIRKSFVENFSIDKIKNMTIEEYVIGTGNQDSFCYIIEKKLGELGQMPPYAGSTKYGVWADREEFQKGNTLYHVEKAFGTDKDPKQAFDKVKNAIVELLEAGLTDNRCVICKSPIQVNYKYKLLYTYYPNQYINICAKDHAGLAIYTLGFIMPDNYELLEMTDEIIKWRNNNIDTKEWSNYIVTRFLYDKLKIKENATEDFNKAKSIKARDEAARHQAIIEAQERINNSRELERMEKEKNIRENNNKLLPGQVYDHKSWGKVEVVEVNNDKVRIKIIYNGEIKTMGIATIFNYIS